MENARDVSEVKIRRGVDVFRNLNYLVPNSKVCHGRGALGVGDDFGSAFFLDENIHGPTSLGGIVRNANNMSDLLVDFGFMTNSDSAKI